MGEVTCGGSPHLSCKRDQIEMSDYMDRRVTPPTWGLLAERSIVEREVAGSISAAAPILRTVLKYRRNEGTPFALQAVRASCRSDYHVKWGSCLQLET